MSTVLQGLTNANFVLAVREANPSFKAITPYVSAEYFKTHTVEAFLYDELSEHDRNTFMGLQMQIYIDKVVSPSINDVFAGTNLMEEKTHEFGAIAEHILVDNLPPINPFFVGLTNGQIVSPFITRTSNQKDIFFEMNAQYQNMYTRKPDEMRKVVSTEYGLSALDAALLQAVMNGKKEQDIEYQFELINTILHSKKFALQDTQVVDVAWPENPTDDQIVNLIRTFKDIKTTVKNTPISNKFNAQKYRTGWDIDNAVMVIKAGVKNKIETIARLNTPEGGVAIPFKQVAEVLHFGGLIPYSGDENTVILGAVGTGSLKEFTANYLGLNPKVYVGNNEVTTGVTISEVNGTGVGGASMKVTKVTFTNAPAEGAEITIKGKIVRYPVHQTKFGYLVGYASEPGRTADDEDGTNFTGYKGAVTTDFLEIDNVKMYDPDPDTIAMICEPGILEKVIQAPLKSSSVYNDLTLTQNFIFSQPNISYRYLPYKGCIVVKRNKGLES